MPVPNVSGLKVSGLFVTTNLVRRSGVSVLVLRSEGVD